ncbi:MULTISPECIES: protein YgfX [unclassified Pseudomonas]|uniref:protein YgfX n=1 Tax=unclassified Pseudomonas TaxID=196821 RepID=UPI000BE3653E|nr:MULTISPECIES: protein YgfX [unclassified Pseudomonas]
MSSPSEAFTCRWRASPRLLGASLLMLALAVLASLSLALPFILKVLLALACLACAAWGLPRHVLLAHRESVTGLRHDRRGWWLYSQARGWHSVELRRDIIALRSLVVVRYRIGGRGWVRSVCVLPGSLPADAHRRLRVHLRFGRRRWAVPASA